jgi:protoporphyrin/coproporphyrin ferrochelatase
MKAILLVDMGSPSSEKEMKTFLRNMFLDPAIIPFPSIFRNILSLIISNARFKKSWFKYELIGGSPLFLSDENLSENLSEALGNGYMITNAFSYSSPLIKDKIASLYKQGIRNLQVIPLYPHFSFTTTGSVKSDISKIQRKYKDLDIHLTERFCNNPNFIKYWQTLIEDSIEKNNLSSPLLVFSAHSIPAHNIKKGDTYVNEINESCEKIAQSLGLEYRIAYQSKMSGTKWVEPDTKSMLKQLSTEDIKDVLLVPISFLSENLETIYDLDTDIVPYAQKHLNFRNISRVRFHQSHPLLIQTLKSLIIPEKKT